MFCCHAQRLPSPLQTAMPFTDWHFKIIHKNIDHSRTSQTASFLPSCHSTRQGCSAHGSKGQNPVMPFLSHPSDPSNDGMPWDAASPTSEKRSALSEFIAINSPNFIHKYPHYSKQSIVACFATNPDRKGDETAVSIGNNLCPRGGAVVSLANIPETAPRNCPFRIVLQCLFWRFACFRTAWSGTKDDWGHAHWH